MTELSLIALLGFIYLLSLFGTAVYKELTITHKILANVNLRTLHKVATPTGGGLIFSVIFVSSMLYYYYIEVINFKFMLIFGVGGTIAILVGYYDDLKGIKPLKKLLMHAFLALWIVFFLNGGPLNELEWLSGWPSWVITSFLLIWLINVYNFIDGIDGLAITGSILILSTIMLTLIISNNVSDLFPIFLVLLFSCLGFLFFNWPKASIFMGDVGSIFLGYIFGAFIVYSVMTNEISFATWMVVFGYYLVDTTTTTLTRIILVKNWYGSHRSHAYQNIARVLDNHAKVTFGVIAYHLVWLLPMAIWTVLMPDFSFLAVICAFMPSLVWSIKFGPLFSKD